MFGAPKPAGSGFNNQQQNSTQSTGLFGAKPAGGTGLFGSQPQQPAQSTSLFGKPAQQPGTTQFGQTQPQTGGLFGQNSQPQQTGSLFGQNNQQPQTGSLFGQSNQQGGSLFGQNNQQQQQQPQQQTSLFGQNNQQTQPTNSLFGNNANQQQGGLFSSNTNNQQQQQQPGQSLFGQNNTQQQPGSLFGQNNTNTQQTTSGSGLFGAKPLFGSTAPASGTGTNSTGLFSLSSQPQQSQQSQQQQQQQQLPLITPFTRPGDLPEPFQKELEKMDSYIRGQQQLSEDLSHATSDHKRLVESIPRDVQLLKFKLTSAKETLKFDDGQLAKLKSLVDQDYANGELLAEVTNQPRKYDRLLPYFHKNIECEPRLEQLSLAMRDVQQAVTAEEFGKRVTYDRKGLAALPGALKEEYLYFMSLSDGIAELHRHIKENGESEALDEINY